MRPVTLYADRVNLVPPSSEHVRAITDACQDPEIPRWTGSVPSPYRIKDAEYYISSSAKKWAEGTGATWVVVRRGENGTDGDFIGIVSLNEITGDSASIGYWTAPGARGHGLTREACERALDYGFSPRSMVSDCEDEEECDEDVYRMDDDVELPGLELQRISWSAMVGNIPSAALARTVGFRFEGTSRKSLSAIDGRILDMWQAGILSSDEREPSEWPNEVFEDDKNSSKPC